MYISLQVKLLRAIEEKEIIQSYHFWNLFDQFEKIKFHFNQINILIDSSLNRRHLIGTGIAMPYPDVKSKNKYSLNTKKWK